MSKSKNYTCITGASSGIGLEAAAFVNTDCDSEVEGSNRELEKHVKKENS